MSKRYSTLKPGENKEGEKKRQHQPDENEK